MCLLLSEFPPWGKVSLSKHQLKVTLRNAAVIDVFYLEERQHSENMRKNHSLTLSQLPQLKMSIQRYEVEGFN